MLPKTYLRSNDTGAALPAWARTGRQGHSDSESRLCTVARLCAASSPVPGTQAAALGGPGMLPVDAPTTAAAATAAVTVVRAK